MSASNNLGLARLRADVDRALSLQAAQQIELDRGRRQRKWFFVSLLCQAIAVAVVLFLVIYMLVARGDGRAYYNDQLKKLVCAVPPGEVTRDQLRSQFDCPAYQRPGRPASTAPSGSPTPTRSATPSPTRTGEAALDPAPARSSSREARVAASPNAVPSRVAAPRTVTAAPRTATRTTVRTAPPSPSTTPGLLPGLLCALLGCTKP